MKHATRLTTADRHIQLLKFLCAGVAAALLFGCAQKLRMEPVSMIPEKVMGAPLLLQASVTGASSAGYSRTLKIETRWLKIGAIRQGEVLKPLDTTLTAEAGHVREANIVVSRNQWVGFWLPVEQAFSPLKVQKPIKFYTGASQ